MNISERDFLQESIKINLIKNKLAINNLVPILWLIWTC